MTKLFTQPNNNNNNNKVYTAVGNPTELIKL